MLGVVLSILAQAAVADDSLERYRQRTAAGPYCEAASRADDIIVCGRRRADRYRLLLIEYDAGDPRDEAVPVERERLLARMNNCDEKSIFLVECGMMGVSVGTGGVRLGGERPIAP
jgi:hypothetical protein